MPELPDEIIVRVDDVERDQPRHHRLDDDDPPEDVEQNRQNIEKHEIQGKVSGRKVDGSVLAVNERARTPGGENFEQHRVRDTSVEDDRRLDRSEEHTSELQSLMRISSAVFC